jgi:hypothetical protein
MGRQIQHLLTAADEARLTEHLQDAFRVLVVDSVYPASWDRRTLRRTKDAELWVIADERTVPILLEHAARLSTQPSGARGGRAPWTIRSMAMSCVEWSRSPQRTGRLYLDTTPHPIWADTSAAAGDDVERMYDRACRWIHANCTNCGGARRGVWVSRDRVPEYERMQEEAAARKRARPRDPRDARFYELRRKAERSLTAADKAALGRYCDAMLSYLGDDPAAAAWRAYKAHVLGAPSRARSRRG